MLQAGDQLMRADLIAMVEDQLSAAIDVSEAGAYGRAREEKAPREISICLGPGRCGFPVAGSDTRVCAFCLRVTPGYGAAERVKDIAKRFVGGN